MSRWLAVLFTILLTLPAFGESTEIQSWTAPPYWAPPASADRPDRHDTHPARGARERVREPGAVTTILEERERFEVFRLIVVTGEIWTVEAFRVPKVDFESWFERERRAIRDTPEARQ